jgi:hypothetical protein
MKIIPFPKPFPKKRSVTLDDELYAFNLGVLLGEHKTIPKVLEYLWTRGATKELLEKTERHLRNFIQFQ